MNKLIIAICAGFFLGNDKARADLAKNLKTATSKAIDIFNKNNFGGDVVDDEASSLHTSTETIQKNE